MTEAEKRRAKENAHVLKLFKGGCNLAKVDSEALRWPPRKVIEKDPKALKTIYGE